MSVCCQVGIPTMASAKLIQKVKKANAGFYKHYCPLHICTIITPTSSSSNPAPLWGILLMIDTLPKSITKFQHNDGIHPFGEMCKMNPLRVRTGYGDTRACY